MYDREKSMEKIHSLTKTMALVDPEEDIYLLSKLNYQLYNTIKEVKENEKENEKK